MYQRHQHRQPVPRCQPWPCAVQRPSVSHSPSAPLPSLTCGLPTVVLPLRELQVSAGTMDRSRGSKSKEPSFWDPFEEAVFGIMFVLFKGKGALSKRAAILELGADAVQIMVFVLSPVFTWGEITQRSE